MSKWEEPNGARGIMILIRKFSNAEMLVFDTECFILFCLLIVLHLVLSYWNGKYDNTIDSISSLIGFDGDDKV